MDFSFRFDGSNSFAATIETADSLIGAETAETAGSLAWVSGSGGDSIDKFVSTNPFAPAIDYSKYGSTAETAGSLAFDGAETAGSLAASGFVSGDSGACACSGDFGGGGFASVC